uniref:Uncharacterized protein n=1 Tax=Opuntia streptacantha TaxID=393608 RepID=A0A7C9CM79_OPUST
MNDHKIRTMTSNQKQNNAQQVLARRQTAHKPWKDNGEKNPQCASRTISENSQIIMSQELQLLTALKLLIENLPSGLLTSERKQHHNTVHRSCSPQKGVTPYT